MGDFFWRVPSRLSDALIAHSSAKLRKNNDEVRKYIPFRNLPERTRLAPSCAELDGAVVVGNEFHIGTQEVVDRPRKIGARQSSVISITPPRIIVPSAVSPIG
jgi:hypothetical protein